MKLQVNDWQFILLLPLALLTAMTTIMADVEALRAHTHRLGLTLNSHAVRDAQELRRAISRMESERLQAAIVFNTPLLLAHRDTLVKALSQILPVISEGRDFARAGALLTYSADYVDMYRRSAAYVDKILKGARPGEIPIERAVTFDLVVNMKTAKALGISIPESILLGANEVLR